MLKKAPAPICTLAREATRYLETQFERNNQHVDKSSTRSTRQHRLIAQEQSEQVPWGDLVDAYTPSSPRPHPEDPSGEKNTLPGEARVSSADDIPPYLRSTLQCALHFERSRKSTKTFEVAYYRLSDDHHLSPPENSSDRADFPATFRASGSELRQFAPHLGLPLREITRQEVEEAEAKSKAWQREQQQQQSAADRGAKGKGREASTPSSKRKLFVP
jgi:hypothetical protein